MKIPSYHTLSSVIFQIFRIQKTGELQLLSPHLANYICIYLNNGLCFCTEFGWVQLFNVNVGDTLILECNVNLNRIINKKNTRRLCYRINHKILLLFIHTWHLETQWYRKRPKKARAQSKSEKCKQTFKI